MNPVLTATPPPPSWDRLGHPRGPESGGAARERGWMDGPQPLIKPSANRAFIGHTLYRGALNPAGRNDPTHTGSQN